MKLSIHNTKFLLALILLLAAVLRLYHIDYQSLWLDEIHTINESNPSLTLAEFYQVLCDAEPHPPMYFYIARLSFYFFGHTAITIRVLSAILGIAGVWSIYFLGRELYSKKAGLIASLLMAVNYFHISYSQDARPYPLLFLTTVISFIFLIRFIKNPSLKSSLLYGFFAGVMLYSHLFSLFALCSQCVILLYYIFRPQMPAITAKKMFLYCLLSGLIVIIMYLPCLEILFISASRTSMWIPKPEPDAYISLLKEFFGNYDIQLVIVGAAAVLFITGVIKENKDHENPGRLKLSAVVLFLWIFITLLLPWLRSYFSLPIIVSRYFINILPVVIVVVSIGIMQLKSNWAKYIMVGLLSLLSLYNIIIRKDYYNTIKNTQFREATAFIKNNNNNGAVVVSSLGWYLPFYINNANQGNAIITMSLEEYTEKNIQNKSSIEQFWYMDAHNRPYKVSDSVQAFLDQNFIVEDSYDGFDVWVRHYIPSKNATIDILDFGKLQKNNRNQIKYNLEKFEYTGGILKASGWAFLSDTDSDKSKIRLCLIKNNEAKPITTAMSPRNDVTSYFKLSYNADNSGFKSEYNVAELESGHYKLAIYIINKDHKISGMAIIDKEIVK